MESPVANSNSGNSSAESKPSPEIVREELNRILNSRVFKMADGQRRFLAFTVEQVLAGRGQSLKEYEIAIEVFRRRQSFDPKSDSIVRSEASHLRARLAKYYETEGLANPLRIEFSKGRGSYAPTFRQIPQQLPPEAQDTPKGLATLETAVTPPLRTARLHRATAFAALLLVAVLVGYMLHSPRSGNADSPSIHSIAVLPLVNLSADKNDEFFSDGLTEELMESLTRMPGLKVVARASAFQFRGRLADVRTIGKQLDVRNVIEGTVARFGDQFRITVRLEDATNGYQLWAQSYNCELKDTPEIQQEISEAIVNSLGLNLSEGRIRPAPFSPETVPDPEAHIDYLKGLYFWNKATPESLETAIGLYQKAIQKDPRFALAYEALADSYMAVPHYTTTPATEMIPKIREAAQTALSLDKNLGEAHIDLALADGLEYDWSSADKEFQIGLGLEPRNTVAHRMYSAYLSQIGKLDEALLENQRSMDLDPVSPYLTQAIARNLFGLRRYDDAIAQYQKCLALDPNYGEAHRGLGMVYLKKGMYSQGIAELRKAREIMQTDPWTISQLGFAYGESGNRAEALRILDDLSKHAPIPAVAVAEVYLGLGDKDRSFEWLAKAVNDKGRIDFKSDPTYDPLRSDPRFATLLQRMNLSSENSLN
jgi:TolB-like protein